jgi:hypothetical protein
VLDDSHFTSRTAEHTVRIHRFDEGGVPFSHTFMVRYPVKHCLFTLKMLVLDQVPAFQPHHTPSDHAINRINDCAISTVGGVQMQGDRIDCPKFFHFARDIDPYLLSLWKFMRETPMTKAQDLSRSHWTPRVYGATAHRRENRRRRQSGH